MASNKDLVLGDLKLEVGVINGNLPDKKEGYIHNQDHYEVFNRHEYILSGINASNDRLYICECGVLFPVFDDAARHFLFGEYPSTPQVEQNDLKSPVDFSFNKKCLANEEDVKKGTEVMTNDHKDSHQAPTRCVGKMRQPRFVQLEVSDETKVICALFEETGYDGIEVTRSFIRKCSDQLGIPVQKVDQLRMRGRKLGKDYGVLKQLTPEIRENAKELLQKIMKSIGKNNIESLPKYKRIVQRCRVKVSLDEDEPVSKKRKNYDPDSSSDEEEEEVKEKNKLNHEECKLLLRVLLFDDTSMDYEYRLHLEKILGFSTTILSEYIIEERKKTVTVDPKSNQDTAVCTNISRKIRCEASNIHERILKIKNNATDKDKEKLKKEKILVLEALLEMEGPEFQMGPFWLACVNDLNLTRHYYDIFFRKAKQARGLKNDAVTNRHIREAKNLQKLMKFHVFKDKDVQTTSDEEYMTAKLTMHEIFKSRGINVGRRYRAQCAKKLGVSENSIGYWWESVRYLTIEVDEKRFGHLITDDIRKAAKKTHEEVIALLGGKVDKSRPMEISIWRLILEGIFMKYGLLHSNQYRKAITKELKVSTTAVFRTLHYATIRSQYNAVFPFRALITEEIMTRGTEIHEKIIKQLS